jgi:hypothetical protein
VGKRLSLRINGLGAAVTGGEGQVGPWRGAGDRMSHGAWGYVACIVVIQKDDEIVAG